MAPTLLNNRYRTIRALGGGGFGETFLGEDTYMPSSRPCVIKQLKPVNNNPQMYQIVQERFQREAAVLEDVGEGSNQIPNLYAYFSEGGQFYLVQEWIEGDTLTQKVQAQGTLSDREVRDILASLLPVLDYIHSKRMVHRDIKPDNIILRKRDGVPVLIDFGAVKEAMGTVLNTQGNPTNSIVVGTPGFMPSEQAAGRPVYSSDLYSLGMTAIYLLTGKLPQQLDVEPRTGEIVWHQHARNASPQLVAVLDRAIQSHARDRYQTARDMLSALQSQAVPQAVPKAAPIATPDISNMETVAVSPGGGGAPVPTPPPRRINLSNWQMPALIGGLIGAVVLAIAVIATRPKSPSSPTATQQTTAPAPTATRTNQPDEARSPIPAATRSPIPVPTASETRSPAPIPVPTNTGRTQTPEPSLPERSQPTSTPIAAATERIRFSSGETGTTLSGSVQPDRSKRYLIRSVKGQEFTVEVLEGDVNVTVTDPAGQTIGEAIEGNGQWQGSLPRTGDYTVEISSPTVSEYRINVEVVYRNATGGTGERSPAASPTSQGSPDDAVRNYYSNIINNRQYETGWNMLSRRYQRNHSRDSYSTYLDWWEQVDRVDVRQVNLVEPGTESAVVDVRLAYIMKDGRVSPESKRFWLVWDAAKGSWVIDDQNR